MVDSPIPVRVTLQDEQGNDVASATVMAPGSHTFRDLLPGATYQVKFSASAPYQVKPAKPDRYTLKPQENALKITVGLDCIIVPDPAIEGLSIPQPPEPPKPAPPIPDAVIFATVAVGLSLALLGDLSGFFSGVRSTAPARPNLQIRSDVTNRPTNGTSRSINRGIRSNRRLPRDLEERLLDCIEEALKSQSDLLQNLEDTGVSTDLATLVPLLIGIEQEEPTDPAIELVQQLKGFIEECDPTLIESIIEAEQENQGNDENDSFSAADQVRIVGHHVNVRTEPHLNSPVVAQVSGGAVAVDRSLATVEGWLPIILPDGQRGYISTEFVSFSAPN
ncbi:SH3 domain-containing protein [Leptolyngbya ohadii]|uniref:SH3 domain-containing protein n=1 Tax=Leptolyngbya ohadii TaxID=1962290 RepID=UPI000B598E97|nr:SH3 domain-containing protein [Leptolyngbya ohadii]